KVIFLEENYRSTQTILSAANAIIKNNKSQKPKNLWTKKEKGAPIVIHEHEDEVAEAEWIAAEIAKQFQKQHVTSNMKHGPDDSSHITPHSSHSAPHASHVTPHMSHAILYRTNAQSRAIEQALIEHNIQYQLFGSIRFYERKEIKDIVACLRYASNPKDAVSLDRMKKSLYAKPFRELMNELPGKAKVLQPYELIVYCLNISNYFEYLKKNYPNADERIENLEELMGFSENYPNLNDFLEKVTLLQSTDNENTKNSKNKYPQQQLVESNESPIKESELKAISYKLPTVSLMTIHIAKGLEFDKVYVVGVNEGLLPHQMSYGTTEEIEEERRLMYVAITRARSELTLSFFDLGSRFLYEIPAELINFTSSDPHGQKDFSDDEERYISFD
ncbi:MAG: 3'-5' exonuclease, partial [bacterium]|nr:3'-5' exonuclease [bacterium]